MVASPALLNTTREIEALRNFFLPLVFDPTGSYTELARVQAHTRAFLVLSHAEIETYLESWAKEIARASEIIWQNHQRMTMPLAFLLSTIAEKIKSHTVLPKDTPQRLSEECVAVFQRYYKQIKDNHGVKEANVLSLFGPIGAPAIAFGATLLPFLESFGEDRGKHAHQAARAVLNALDPETEYQRVLDLLTELEVLDSWLSSYRGAII